MGADELAVLIRAHRLFAADTRTAPVEAGLNRSALRTALLDRTGGGQRRYRFAAQAARDALRATAHTDGAAAKIVAAARTDHTGARAQTGDVVAEARADATAAPDTALAQREAMRRRAARLRAQRAHVLAAHRRALQHRAALRGLRYPLARRRAVLPAGWRLQQPDSRAGRAVRAALSRLGRPYVWGATGPDRFDCSGLTQWAYRQAGVHLDRTTYQQIHDGIPVPRSQIRPGDLVFPSVDHVQLAIGNNLVVEAPHPGAAVQISRLGNAVAIRRPAL